LSTAPTSIDLDAYLARVGFRGRAAPTLATLQALQADYEVSNWYLAHFPQSQFVTGLICARAAPDLRHALRNTRYAVHHPGGLTERRVITRLDDLKGVLRDAMQIPLPESARLDAALQRVLDANPPAS
jgi:N-hydroxyarylamine O-acetyltransferase